MPKSKFVPPVNETVFYCYALLDPRKPGRYRYKTEFGYATFDHEPFYIGKGKGRRSTRHVSMAMNSNQNTRKNSKIRKLIKLGLRPIVVRTASTRSSQEAYNLEVRLIAAIGRLDHLSGPLTNRTDGGEGCHGFKDTLATRALKSSVYHSGGEMTCNYCHVTGSWLPMRRYHFQNCANKDGPNLLHLWETFAPDSIKQSSYEVNRAQGIRKHVMSMPDKTCPHCGYVGRAPSIYRYHFNRCPDLD